MLKPKRAKPKRFTAECVLTLRVHIEFPVEALNAAGADAIAELAAKKIGLHGNDDDITDAPPGMTVVNWEGSECDFQGVSEVDPTV